MIVFPTTGCVAIRNGETCGSLLYTRNTKVWGIWSDLMEIDEAGDCAVVQANLDGLKYGEDPKRVRCAECGQRYLNPSVEGDDK